MDHASIFHHYLNQLTLNQLEEIRVSVRKEWSASLNGGSSAQWQAQKDTENLIRSFMPNTKDLDKVVSREVNKQ
jgi:hypothetical protein